MGKKIDGFVLTVAVALGFYVYFLQAFQNRAVSLVLSFICCLLIRKAAKGVCQLLVKSTFIQKRNLRRRAGSTVMQIACMEASEAHGRLAKLLETAYGNSYEMDIIQFPATASLSQEALFDRWKQHRGEECIVLCVTCRCDNDCRNLAKNLLSPKVALLDADNIASLIAEYPEGFMFREEQKQKKISLQLKKTISLFLNRRNSPRCFLFALSTLGIYLLNGKKCYLVSSLFLFFVSLISLRKTSKPAKLF